MTQYVCDRCGSVSNERLVVVETPEHEDGYSHVSGENKDLCHNCMKAFIDFLKPLAKQANRI